LRLFGDYVAKLSSCSDYLFLFQLIKQALNKGIEKYLVGQLSIIENLIILKMLVF
jgi:hypothetical protein